MDMGNSLKIGSGTNSQLAPSSLLSLLASQLTKHTTSSWYSLDYLGIFSRDKLLKSINRYKRNELLHFLVCKKKTRCLFSLFVATAKLSEKEGTKNRYKMERESESEQDVLYDAGISDSKFRLSQQMSLFVHIYDQRQICFANPKESCTIDHRMGWDFAEQKNRWKRTWGKKKKKKKSINDK